MLRHHIAHHFKSGFSNAYPSMGEPAASTEDEWQAKVTVQGYGVELQIKNMEYKNIDDAKMQGTGTGEGDETEQQEDDGETLENTGGARSFSGDCDSDFRKRLVSRAGRTRTSPKATS